MGFEICPELSFQKKSLIWIRDCKPEKQGGRGKGN
jgi:hypothetical protein